MGMKEKLIERLKKYNGQMFDIMLETSEGFSSYSRIECGDVYVRDEIKNLCEEADYFLDNVINIVDRGTMISFALIDEGVKSVKDNVHFDKGEEWLDKFDIEYESGTTICIDIFKNDAEEITDDEDVAEIDEESPTEQFNQDEYIKELLSRNYFPKDNETLINVLTTLKSLEGKEIIIEHSSNIVSYKFTIEEMVIDEVVGEAIITEGILLMDSLSDTNASINEERIIGIKLFDSFLDEEATVGYEIKFDDGSFTTIEVLNGN